MIDELAHELAARAISHKGDTVVISRAALADRPRHLVREVLQIAWRDAGFPRQAMGQPQWEALAEMLLAEDAQAIAQQDFPGAIRAWRREEELVLAGTR